MFTQRDLQNLNKIQTKTLTLSLYLNTDQRIYKPSEIKVNFKNLLKTLKNDYTKDFLSAFSRRFRLKLKKDIRGLVFFVNPYENIFYEYSLPRPIESGLYLEKNLHLTPLVKLLDEYERYLVLIFDKTRAKIFSVYLGEIEDKKEIKQYFPGKHDMGGWSQARYQRHIEDHLRQNLKKAVRLVSDMARKYDFDRLILAGGKESLPVIKKILPQNLRNKIVGEFKTELFATKGKLLEQIRRFEEKIERQKEKEKINAWQKYLGFGDKSCSGLKKVIKMACQKRILELLLDVNLKKSGFKCFSCGNLSLYPKITCPICGKDMEEVDLVDELVQDVLAQNGKVEFVAGNKELKKLGGVGARLRY